MDIWKPSRLFWNEWCPTFVKVKRVARRWLGVDGGCMLCRPATDQRTRSSLGKSSTEVRVRERSQTLSFCVMHDLTYRTHFSRRCLDSICENDRWDHNTLTMHSYQSMWLPEVGIKTLTLTLGRWLERWWGQSAKWFWPEEKRKESRSTQEIQLQSSRKFYWRIPSGMIGTWRKVTR